VTWVLPELELGVLLELMPLELELPELELPELELPELELPELDEPELVEDEPEFADVEPVDDEPADVVSWVEPGRARASAPAATTLATLTAVVAERTFSRPFFLAAMARRIPSRCALMSSILWPRLRKSLHEPSR